jgi:hypothetical protein
VLGPSTVSASNCAIGNCWDDQKCNFVVPQKISSFQGDIDPTEGIQHAKAIAQRISSYHHDESQRPNTIFSSPFLRTTHTSQIIADALPGSRIKVEEGLFEWLVPSLLVEPNGVRTYPKSVEELASDFKSIDLLHKSVNPLVDDDATIAPPGSPKFVESEEKLVERCM